MEPASFCKEMSSSSFALKAERRCLISWSRHSRPRCFSKSARCGQDRGLSGQFQSSIGVYGLFLSLEVDAKQRKEKKRARARDRDPLPVGLRGHCCPRGRRARQPSSSQSLFPFLGVFGANLLSLSIIATNLPTTLPRYSPSFVGT